jgi:uncharacterized protein involved in exopolysaccharide biosynthesis
MREMNPRSSIREHSLDISLRDMAAPLFRRRRVLIAVFLVTLIAGIMAGILAPLEFTSHMAILVNRERLDPLVTTESTTQLITNGNPVSEEEINSEAELLKSSDLLEDVVLANGLEKQHGRSLLDLFRPKQDEADRVERAVRSLAVKLKVAPASKTNMIDVTYSSSDPQLSYEVLNTLGNLYMEKHVAVHRPPGSYEFFAQETQKYEQALQDAEGRLRSFGEQQGAAAPDLERTDLAVQVTNSVGEMHSTEQAIAADEQRIRSDQEQMKVTPERSATKQDSDAANLLLQNLGSSLLAAETKRTQLLLKYAPSYPLVQEADQEVAEAQAAIAQAEETPYINQETDRDPTFELLREDRAKTEADLAAQHANLAAVKRSIQSLQTQMADLDQKAVTQQDLQRDVKANEDNYLLYLSKREQERTSDALDKTRIANVAIAVPPAIPALPTHSFPSTILVALLSAMLLSITVAYIVEYFDSSFHTPAQVIDMLGIPVVVAVPKKTA